MRLDSLTRPELIFSGLPGVDGPSVLRGMAERIVAVSSLDNAETLYQKLLEREQLSSTGIGGGVAIPHCKIRRLDHVLLAVGICRKAVDFSAVDGKPVRLFFVIASPEDQPANHLKALAAISKWIKADDHVKRILKLSEASEIYQLLASEEA